MQCSPDHETQARSAADGAPAGLAARPDATREFEFTFSDGGTEVARFTLRAGEYVIGSALTCQISIELEGLAPEHARLRLGREATIENLDTEIGTFLQGELLTSATKVPREQPITFGAASGELRLERCDPPEAEAFEPSASEPTPLFTEARPPRKGGRSRKKRRAPVAAPALPETPEPANHNVEVSFPIADLEPRAKDGFTIALAAFELPAGSAAGPATSGGFVTCVLPPSAPEDALPFASETQERLTGGRDQLEAEVFRLKVEMEDLRTERAELAEEAAPLPKPPPEKEHAGLLSVANSVLFKKFTEATESAKQSSSLLKQLKQREEALVEAWARRQAAEERCAMLGKKLARYEQGEVQGVPPVSAKLSAVALTAGAALLIAVLVLSLAFRSAEGRARRAEAIVLLLKTTAQQFHGGAVAMLEAGELRAAGEKVAYALALEPDVATYHVTNGHIHQSLLQIPAAQAAYERALALDPARPGVAENLELCRRISRSRHGAQSMESQYALHRIMMEQRRFREALRVAQRLETDRPLLHQTWAALLIDSGISGELHLNEEGSFDLELRPGAQADLAPLRGLPLRSLKAARLEIADVSPLAGMPLKRLDLAGTRVRDLAPLQGMPLEALDVSNTFVVHLLALRGMPLQELRIDHTSITDLSELRALPLRELSLAGTRVWNLAPLMGMPLKTLNLAQTPVKDLGILQHLPLERLNLEGTAVTDLAPLRSAPLSSLSLVRTAVVSLEALRGIPLRELTLAGCHQLQSLEPLVGCVELERLVLPRPGPKPDPLRTLPSLRFLSYERDGGSGEDGQTAQQFWAPETK